MIADEKIVTTASSAPEGEYKKSEEVDMFKEEDMLDILDEGTAGYYLKFKDSLHLSNGPKSPERIRFELNFQLREVRKRLSEMNKLLRKST